MEKRVLAAETPGLVGKAVLLQGWVQNRRDHGKLIFIDFRDRSGLIQVVFTPKSAAYEAAGRLRNEWVVEIEGAISERPSGMQNQEISTGSVECQAEGLRILSEAETPPIPIDDDGHAIDEELRLKYRYLDLRRARMQKNIRLRAKAATLAREYLNQNGFIEIETPLLTKTSPEGARDFLVPSRIYPGNFYALPQAPQQYKQLLMIAGFERYYQIAKALRDEDARGDRQPEHTQIDLEMSFAGEDDVLNLVEGLMIHITEGCGKKILEKPFPRFTHEEAVKKFGADKFDLRPEPKDPNVLAFAWVTDFPLFEKDEAGGTLTFAHNPFSAPKREHVEKLMKGEELGELRAQQYDLVANGYELASGGVRISDPTVQEKVFEIMGLSKSEIEERFGHMLKAYRYGAPPHAGAAPGLDRLVMLLADETSIPEVIAFPKTGTARDPLMDSPSPATPEQLTELHIKIVKE